MKNIVYILSVLTMVSCGQGGNTPSVDAATTSSSAAADNVVAKSSAASVQSVQTSEGQYARLVSTITDLACDASNQDQLIYVQDEKLFYSCDNAEWVAIEIQGATGEQGIQGEKGDTGAQGANGSNGTDGATGSSLIATYSDTDWLGTRILNSNSNQNIRSMTLAVYSDGSYTFAAEVYVNGVVYHPTFFMPAYKASTAVVKHFPLLGSYNDLSFQFPKGSDMLATANTAIASSWNNGQSLQVGIALYTHGNAPTAFQNFTLNGDY